MSDLKLILDAESLTADLVLTGGDLATSDGLFESVMISLFSDARARPDDVIPDGTSDRRGWWGDAFADVPGDQTGSRLWLLSRAKITAETVRLVEDYVREALTWLTREGVARAVEVSAERRNTDGVAFSVSIHRPDDRRARFDFIWRAYA